MRNYFTFNGVDSRDFGVYISGNGRVTIPEKAPNFQTIPGRYGDLIIGKPAIPNEIITYPAFIAPYNDSGITQSFTEMASRLRAFLMSVDGYAELTDSYDSGHYRLATFTGPTEFEITQALDAGSFDLEFNCKPLRYLTDSDVITVNPGQSYTVASCQFWKSEPLITVRPSNTLPTIQFQIGDSLCSMTNIGYPITIDCRRLECWDSRGNNANRYVNFPNNEFPTIENGSVLYSQYATLIVEPRWYEL